MKIVKINIFGTITTTLDGVLYHIDEKGIQVSDEVAQKMKDQYLHTIEVVDIVPVEEPKSVEEDTSVDEAESPVKPKKSKKNAKHD